MKPSLQALIAGLLLVLVPQIIHAQTKTTYRQSDYGGVGLMQMPSARMNPEGELSLNYRDNDPFRRISLSMQLFPWLETTVRYTDIRYERYSIDPEFSNQTLKDKGLDVKLNLLNEGRYQPELAIGLRDLGGTGLYSGEYIVASKQLFNSADWGAIDVTAGIGWGYLGVRDNINNPLCHVDDRFCQRSRTTSGTGGQFEVDDWFRGSSALFAGVEYQTPWQPLVLQVEYDANDYSQERLSNPVDPNLTEPPVYSDSPLNWGAQYALNDHVQLNLSYQRGNTWMFGITLHADLDGAEQIKVKPRKRAVLSVPQTDEAELTQALKSELGIELSGWQIQGTTLTLYQQGEGNYRNRAEQLERATRIATHYVAEDIKRYEWVTVNQGMAINSYNVDVDEFKQIAYGARFTKPLSNTYSQSEARAWSAQQGEARTLTPDWDVTWRPSLSQSFGSAESFYFYQFAANADINITLTPRWQVNASIGMNVLNNYDQFTYRVDDYESPLPRVRTYVREYYADTDVWLSNLYSQYTAKLKNNWYGAAYAGYLERMFAGAGTSVLYRPQSSDWAFGGNLNWVKQRSFDEPLGLRDYKVWTGHLSAYWQTPWLERSLVKLDAGRFLAGDEGVKVTFEHRFESGVVAGAYAALTNVSAEDYGEGSFTKGLYLSIPFDLFSVKSSIDHAGLSWEPITRDGGQTLKRPVDLYRLTDLRQPFYLNGIK